MNRTFCFTLQIPEYVDFLAFQISRRKKMRAMRWLFVAVVPAALAAFALVLRIRAWLMLTALFVLAAAWVLYGAKPVWKRYLRRKVTREMLPKLNIVAFREMTYHFGPASLEYQEKGRRTAIPVGALSFALFGSGVAFLYGNNAVLIPYRAFSGEQDVDAFLDDFERIRRPAAHAMRAEAKPQTQSG